MPVKIFYVQDNKLIDGLRIGNQQMAKEPRLQSLCHSYNYRHDRA